MAVAGTHSGEPDWVGHLAPLPASTVETSSCPATQGTTTWIQAEGSAHVCGSGKSTTNHVTIKGQMHQRYARNSMWGRGGESEGVHVWGGHGGPISMSLKYTEETSSGRNFDSIFARRCHCLWFISVAWGLPPMTSKLHEYFLFNAS